MNLDAAAKWMLILAPMIGLLYWAVRVEAKANTAVKRYNDILARVDSLDKKLDGLILALLGEHRHAR